MNSVVDRYIEDAKCPNCGSTRVDTHAGWKCPECNAERGND